MFGTFHTQNDHIDWNARMQAAGQTRETGRGVEQLNAKVERLEMICEALWRLLKEKHGYEDVDLIEKVTQVDLEDGQLDGRNNKKDAPKECPRCRRVMMRNRPKCLYCGEVVLPDLF